MDNMSQMEYFSDSAITRCSIKTMDSIFEHQGSGSGDRRSSLLDRRPDPWCQDQNEDDLTVRCDGRFLGLLAIRTLMLSCRRVQMEHIDEENPCLQTH